MGVAGLQLDVRDRSPLLIIARVNLAALGLAVARRHDRDLVGARGAMPRERDSRSLAWSRQRIAAGLCTLPAPRLGLFTWAMETGLGVDHEAPGAQLVVDALAHWWREARHGDLADQREQMVPRSETRASW